MDEIGPDGTLRHVVAMHTPVRWLFVIGGAFVMAISVWELWRGVWPINLASPFFAFMIAGGFSVGFPMAYAGFFAPTQSWTVRQGAIEIELRNPFGSRIRRFTRSSVEDFEYREHEWDGRANSWSVVMRTTGGERFETRDFNTLAAATVFRERIEQAFGA